MTLRLNGSTSGYVEIDAPAVAGTSVLTLPTGTGTLATQASVGLVKIVDQSFTAASSVSVNNCFTSAYENYSVVITGTSSTSALDVAIRFRSNGTDDTGSNYSWQYIRSSGTTVSGARSSNYGDNIWIGSMDSGGPSAFNILVFSPALATGKTVISQSVLAATLTTLEIRNHVGGSKNTAAFDGLTIVSPSGNITGKIRIYGHQN